MNYSRIAQVLVRIQSRNNLRLKPTSLDPAKLTKLDPVRTQPSQPAKLTSLDPAKSDPASRVSKLSDLDPPKPTNLEPANSVCKPTNLEPANSVSKPTSLHPANK